MRFILSKINVIKENQQVVSHSPGSPKNSTPWLMDLIFLALLFSLFYFIWLGSYPLFTPDEGRYSEVAREMLTTGDYITPHVNSIVFLDKPILYYWLQAIALKILGVNEWAVRFFPALIGVAGCLITYACGKLLFDRRTGLLSATILATSPLFFGTAHYADLNLEVAVFISSSLLFFITGIRLTEQQQSGHWAFISAYVCAALAILTKGLIGIVFPCLIVGSWLVLQWRWKTLQQVYLVSGLILMTILVLPWYVMVQQANPDFFHYFFIVQQFTRFVSAATFNNPTPIWFYFPVVLVGFFPWSIFVIQALYAAIKNCYQKNPLSSIYLFLLLWLGIVFAFFSVPQSKTVGYIVPIFPVLALLTGNFLAKQWHQPRQKAIYFSLVLFFISALALSAVLVLLPSRHWINFAPQFIWHLSIIAIILLSAALMAFLTLRATTLRTYICLCAFSSIASLLVLTEGAAYLNQNSAKPLLVTLKSRLQPGDVVVNYYNFFQDSPMYLGQEVKIVANWSDPSIPTKDNWQREMWFGKSFQTTNHVLIDETKFWQLWDGDQSVYTLMNQKYFDHFKQHTRHYYIIQSYNEIFLVSNRPDEIVKPS